MSEYTNENPGSDDPGFFVFKNIRINTCRVFNISIYLYSSTPKLTISFCFYYCLPATPQNTIRQEWLLLFVTSKQKKWKN